VLVFTHVTAITAVAYGVRVGALIAVGALVGWLHEDEVKAAKLFQLGMVAPALLTGMLNGAAVRADAGTHLAWSFATPVYAAQQERALPSVAPAPSTSAQIYQGFFGVTAEPADRLLVVESYESQTSARHRLAALSEQFPRLTFTLWHPEAASDAPFLLTVGGLLTERQVADSLKALAAGPAPSVRLVRLPQESAK
jgi:hypothetical protein